MKIAIVKDWRDKDIWGPSPVLWAKKTNTLRVLQSFLSRCQAWGMMYSEHADLRIINVDEQWYDNRSRICAKQAEWNAKKGLWNELLYDNKAFWELHKHPQQTDHVDADVSLLVASNYPTQEEINWGEYDIVITTNPWLKPEVTTQHPRIVFGYWNYAAHWDYYVSQTQGHPFDKQYDLHLDHIEGPRELIRLPQSIYFPYPTNTAIRADFANVQKEYILAGKRTLGENRELREMWRTLQIGDLKVKLSSGRRDAPLANGQDYFMSLASSKYLVYVRNLFAGSGQKILEGAALGCIVVGYHWGRIFHDIVHPACQLEASYIFPCRERPPFGVQGCSANQVVGKLRDIEQSPALQKEIIAYQDEHLNTLYLSQMANLIGALRLKRREQE